MHGKCQPVLILFLHLHGLQTQINHTTISKKILYFSKGEVCPFFRTHLIFFQIPQYLVGKIQTSTYLVRIREPILIIIINISADITPSHIKPFLKKETGSVPSFLLRTLPNSFLSGSFYIQPHVPSEYILAGWDCLQFSFGDGGHGK